MNRMGTRAAGLAACAAMLWACGGTDADSSTTSEANGACETDDQLEVSKTAYPAIDRTWHWSIEKLADPNVISLPLGGTYDIGYSVAVEATGYEDGGYGVSGDITIHNPTSKDATIENVMDSIEGGIIALVDCGVSFPQTLPAGQTMTCTYISPLPDDATRMNNATVMTSGLVAGAQGYAEIDFACATMVSGDDCVLVEDSMLVDPLGTVCAREGRKVFEYTRTVGPWEVCGSYEVQNIATYETNDTHTKGQDDAVVNVDIACTPGCTLTPGYWKTHSEYGPARYDDTWGMLTDGADTTFFLSGMSYLEVLNHPVAGNTYYILAHAWIAAELNGWAGADMSAAMSAFEEAEQILMANAPADLADLKGKERSAITNLAEILDDYNNGLIGPGHCE